MKIGIPKEIKAFENRVGLIPVYVKKLVEMGHHVFVQDKAGSGSGYNNESYIMAGAKILDSIEEIYKESDLIVKVKEPQKEEFPLIKKEQILFSFFHFPSSEDLLNALLETECIAVAYETLETDDKKLPILSPMSAVAGKLSIQIGMQYLENIEDGKGLLLGGIPGVTKGNVVIFGGGIVGANACYVASQIGAQVTLLDINLERLNTLSNHVPANVNLLYSNEQNILESIQNADLIVSGVHSVGEKPPKLITKAMLSEMEENTVIVDVSIDQGGAIETSRVTTHHDPIYKVNGILHYCVANMPSIVSKTSTELLSHSSFPYLIHIVNKGIRAAVQSHPEIESAINLAKGSIVNSHIADTFNRKKQSIDDNL